MSRTNLVARIVMVGRNKTRIKPVNKVFPLALHGWCRLGSLRDRLGSLRDRSIGAPFFCTLQIALKIKSLEVRIPSQTSYVFSNIAVADFFLLLCIALKCFSGRSGFFNLQMSVLGFGETPTRLSSELLPSDCPVFCYITIMVPG